jgi:hypothetical protein
MLSKGMKDDIVLYFLLGLLVVMAVVSLFSNLIGILASAGWDLM